MKAYYCGNPDGYTENDWDKLAARAMDSMNQMCKSIGEVRLKAFARSMCPNMPSKSECYVKKPITPSP